MSRHEDEMRSALTGRLLVALPALEDPNFERSVVLVLEHDAEGALGVVLNRPTTTPLEEVLEGLEGLAAAPARVFGGGPVEPMAVVGLGVTRPGPQLAGAPAIVDRIVGIDPTDDPALLAAAYEGVRIFVGYAGWAPGQLEDELAEGAWLVVDAEPDDVVSDDPAGLWAAVLARQDDASTQLLASFPDDPRLN